MGILGNFNITSGIDPTSISQQYVPSSSQFGDLRGIALDKAKSLFGLSFEKQQTTPAQANPATTPAKIKEVDDPTPSDAYRFGNKECYSVSR